MASNFSVAWQRLSKRTIVFFLLRIQLHPLIIPRHIDSPQLSTKQNRNIGPRYSTSGSNFDVEGLAVELLSDDQNATADGFSGVR
jgi:hypothetical protein